MPSASTQARSRRALLAAAVGSAAAVAASAAVPLGVAADDPDDLTLGAINPTTAETGVANAGDATVGFSASTVGVAPGFLGSSTQGVADPEGATASAGMYGWSVDRADAAEFGTVTFTGVYGWSPTGGEFTFGVGVWGDSDDVGVFGTGGTGVYGSGQTGVYGEGDVGVVGQSIDSANYGVIAMGATPSARALQVVGKVNFSRSGRTLMAAGRSTLTVRLAGATATSKVFAVLATSEPGRYVRAVVPAAGSFKVYLNTDLESAAKVAWFVLD
jgi:hypothetical protein